MKTLSLLAVGLLSTVVAADPNGHHKHKKHNGTKHGGECMQLLHSEHVLQTSSNATLMSRLQSNYPKKAAMIKNLAQNATSRITAIQGNSSHPADWLANCHAKGAHMQLKHQCKAKEHLPKALQRWNDATKGPKIKQRHNWTDAQFAQEKGILEAKLKDLNANKTLNELCVKMPKDDKPGKDGKGDKGDGKGGKAPDGKKPDGKAAASQKSAASGINGGEAVRGGLFALAFTLFMAVTIL